MPLGKFAAASVAPALLDALVSEPAPLLAILHGIQDRLGWIPEHELAAVADGLRVPHGDLYGVVSFYHYFRTEAPTSAPRFVCDGPACAMGAQDGARRPAGSSIPCPGRCDAPIAELEPGRTITPSPTFPVVATPGRELVLLRDTLHADQPQLEAARARGAWKSWEAWSTRSPVELLDEVLHSGLQGRGGAGFPCGLKWKAVREARARADGLKYLVVNADEGEPITFKDRPILEHDPHLLLEGMRLAAHAVGATVGIIYLRYEYPEAFTILQRAIVEARHAGLLGPGHGFEVFVRRGAGAYICGEETALLNSLEGKRPFPRDKPPYPTTHGLDGRPTLVNNVETLAAIPRILERGAAWWKANQPKIYSIAGDVQQPGNYELPLGSTARELVAAAGGIRGGDLQFFTLGGLSGGLLSARELDLRLDFDAPKQHGAMLGSGGVLVGNSARCPVDLVRRATDFFRHESCGKCFPCRIGTERSLARLDQLAEGHSDERTLAELRDLGRVMSRTSACGLGVAAPSVIEGLLDRFGEAVSAHRAGRCPAQVCEVRP